MFLYLDAAWISEDSPTGTKARGLSPCQAQQERSMRDRVREMSHMSYQLHLEQEDKARLEDSFKREIETLENYAQVMKDTSDTNKEDADKFLK